MKTRKILLLTLLLTLIMSTSAFATTPTIVTGTLNLLNEATKWLTILIPVSGGFFLGLQAWLRSMAQDDAEKAAKTKLMKNVLIGVVIATSASGLVAKILSFY